jgi:hypothetical protein
MDSRFDAQGSKRMVRRISRRQASQLPRRCDIPAAWVPHKAHAVFYFLMVMAFPSRRPCSVSIVAGRCRPIAAQCGAGIARRDSQAILVRDIASRNAPGCQIRGNEHAKYDFHRPSLALPHWQRRLCTGHHHRPTSRCEARGPTPVSMSESVLLAAERFLTPGIQDSKI